ncbi:hypothetical protein HPB47_003544 [Ixodes persulcatus]|uniref:Uncharacterized protein n=1 Tax=Ixodes persulcatus TaxID=34615 RepID=A0AC60PJA1_IXOPE|nr:hypothetical protein HPB47_003544 [Ixodes persulcatus]
MIKHSHRREEQKRLQRRQGVRRCAALTTLARCILDDAPPGQHRLKSKATLRVFRQSPLGEAWQRHLFDRPSGKLVRCTGESRVTETFVREAVREIWLDLVIFRS